MMETFLAALLSAGLVGALFLLFLPGYVERRRQEATNERAAADAALRQSLDALGQRLDGIQASVGASLSNTAGALGRIGEQLGALGKSTERVLEVGKDIASLQEVLRPPKLRGGFGEVMMERLLAEVVPGRYVCQHRFRSGETVDAVIHLAAGMVPVDSKFPLDAFNRLLAAEDDVSRRAFRREFERAVRTHIDAVARYIKADEGTLDFALMYVPAENVFYELHRSEFGADALSGAGQAAPAGIFAYAQERRVFPVSPSTFYTYLSAIAFGLRGLRVEERARELLGHLARLSQEFDRFQRDFGVLGGHIEQAHRKYDGLNLSLARLGDRLALPLAEEDASAVAEASRQLPAG
jgi:DNA recombination protein RmuC